MQRPGRKELVRCDRRTVAQNDLDNGWLICLVGVAVMEELVLSAQGIDAEVLA